MNQRSILWSVVALALSGGVAACAPKPAPAVSAAAAAAWAESMTGLWSVTMTDGSGARKTGRLCLGARTLAAMLATLREPTPKTCAGRRELRDGVMTIEQTCRTRTGGRMSFESHILSVAGPKAFSSTMDGRMLGGDAAADAQHMAMTYARLGACPASLAEGQLLTDDGRTIDITAMLAAAPPVK